MASPYTDLQLEFIARQYRSLNLMHVDQMMHGMGLLSAVDKARAMATLDVDHVHGGNRYWLTVDVIAACKAYLSQRVAG